MSKKDSDSSICSDAKQASDPKKTRTTNKNQKTPPTIRHVTLGLQIQAGLSKIAGIFNTIASSEGDGCMWWYWGLQFRCSDMPVLLWNQIQIDHTCLLNKSVSNFLQIYCKVILSKKNEDGRISKKNKKLILVDLKTYLKMGGMKWFDGSI